MTAEAAGITLTATPKGSEDYIRLDWNRPSMDQNYTYQVYQKKPGASEYQTIPAKQTVKVLNVYPSNGGGQVTFTDWKGQTHTLSTAASLKMWMEKPNAEDPKGYGKGLISVDPVYLTDFNANPNAFLKNPDGSWKYDAVFFGSWDCNGACNASGDLSVEGRDLLKPFIESGRGVLFGHDTVIGNSSHPNFSSLRNYLNEKLSTYDYGNTIPFIGDNQVVIAKKGLLTNYPWQIGDIGSNLTIPYAHSTSQIAFGDIWMTFAGSTGPWAGNPTVSDPVTGKGTNNFYLTTWNNTAMIQTGHSNGQATPDEQKVLANTLFYLSQITENTSWDDRMGQDVTAPNQPSTPSVSVQNSIVTVNIPATTDNGSQYEYYVEATGGTTGMKFKSNTVSATIVSGVKGYSIEIDQSPNTIPDNTIETSGTLYQAPTNLKGKFYVHVAAIDNAGNKSATTHVEYKESVAPSMTHTVSTTEVTNQDVRIQVSASDASMGVKRIKKVNLGTHGLKGVYYSHPADPNRLPPTTTSGVAFEIVDSQVNFDWGAGSPDSRLGDDFFTVEWSGLVYAPVTGTYTFQTITDDGSRLQVNGQQIIGKWIQQSPTAHNGTIELEGGKWYSIKFSHYENTGSAVAKLLWKHSGLTNFEVIPSQNLAVVDNDGWTNGNTLSYDANEKGAYVFAAEDYFGNMQALTVIINNIDKTPPAKPTVTMDGDEIVIDGEDEGSKILVNINGTGWKEYVSLDHLPDGHYDIQIKVVDNAGNESEIMHIVKDVYVKALKSIEFLFRYAEIYKRDPHLSKLQAQINALPDSQEKRI